MMRIDKKLQQLLANFSKIASVLGKNYSRHRREVRMRLFRRDRVRPMQIKFIRLYDKQMIVRKKKLDKPIYIDADMSLHDGKANSMLRKKKKELITENPDLRCKVMRGKIICSDEAGVNVKEYCVSSNLDAVEARETVGLDMDI